MPDAVDALISLADALRLVQTSTGDLTFALLDVVQNQLSLAKHAVVAALAEGAKDEASAEMQLAELGGPVTLALLSSKAATMNQKANAWNDFLEAGLAALPNSTLVRLVTRTESGVSTKHIEWGQFLTSGQAATVRGSTQLSEFIAALEDIGA